MLVCAGSIVALELWRRHLAKTRALPRWIGPLVWGLFALSVAGVVTARVMMERAFTSIDVDDAGSKASRLAAGISSAMNANALAIAALAVATIALGVCAITLRRR